MNTSGKLSTLPRFNMRGASDRVFAQAANHLRRDQNQRWRSSHFQQFGLFPLRRVDH
jgi:hypothetical protein